MHKLISKRFAQLIYFSGIHRLLCAVQDRLVYWLRDYWKKSHLIVLGEKKSNRLAIFSIYQLSDLSVFIESQLDYLIKLGYDVAVAVPHELRQADQDYLDQRCRFRIMRQNVGRDFGSYKDAILKVGFDRISEYQRVLLINDSIFFPMGDTGAFEKIFSHPGLTLLDSAKIQIITVIFLLFLLILIQKFFVNKKLNNIGKSINPIIPVFMLFGKENAISAGCYINQPAVSIYSTQKKKSSMI